MFFSKFKIKLNILIDPSLKLVFNFQTLFLRIILADYGNLFYIFTINLIR